jgi:methyltransferase (TIGR00027 family)
MEAGVASRTAVLVCQGRAVAQGRLALGRFDDPVALELLHEDERAEVALARGSTPPSGWAPRLRWQTLRATGPVMALRTVLIDDAIRAAGNPQLVVLGAGLDARAWRLAVLADVEVYEVDHPASQRDKRARLGARVPLAGRHVFVPVDLTRDDLAAALRAAGHDAGRPTTWVWEGVVPYLAPADVQATVAVLGGISAPGSRLIVNYVHGTLAIRLGRLLAAGLLRFGGGVNPWASEPWRSTWTPAQLAELLAGQLFRVVADPDPLTVAEGLGLPGRAPTLRHGRVAIADRQPRLLSG